MKSLAWLFAVPMVLAFGEARAQVLLTVGSEFQINTYTTNSQWAGGVCVDEKEDFVVVWDSLQVGGGVFGQRYRSTGGVSGTEFQINTYTTSPQYWSSVACDQDGDFAVVWQDGSVLLGGGREGSPGIFGQRYRSTGAASGGEFQINTYTTNEQIWPAVSMDQDGDFVVVWESYGQESGSALGVFGQRYRSTGAAVGGEFQINTYTTNDQGSAAVSMDQDGDFAVVWDSKLQDGSFRGVFGQRYRSTGAASGGEFQISTYTTSNQYRPAVSLDQDGDFAVVWNSRYQDGSSWGVFGQRYRSTGTAVGGEFQINTYTTNDQGSAAVSVERDGDVAVVWTSRYQDGSGDGVFGQRYRSTGAAVGGEFQINTYTTDWQWGPLVGTLSNNPGGFVVVWTSDKQDDGAYNGVFAQRYYGAMCGNSPRAGCRTAAKSLLLIKDKTDDTKDKMLWKWIKGAATTQADFGDPVASTYQGLCIYNESGLVVAAEVDPGGTCDGKPCWKALSTKGYKFKDKSAGQDGVFKVMMKGGAAAKSKVLVKGKGTGLPMPALPIPTPGTGKVTVQVVNTDTGACFTGEYSGAQIIKNDGTKGLFKAKAP